MKEQLKKWLLNINVGYFFLHLMFLTTFIGSIIEVNEIYKLSYIIQSSIFIVGIILWKKIEEIKK